MDDIVDGSIDNELEALQNRWEDYYNEIVPTIEYEYKFYDVITYEDEIGPEIPKPRQEDRVIAGTHIRCQVIFNKFTDQKTYRDHLFRLVETYKTAFLEFIDNVNFSVGERLKYFTDQLDEIEKIKKSVFHVDKFDQNPSRHEESVINERGGEDNFLKTQNDFNKYGEMIQYSVYQFIFVQFESLLYLQKLLTITANFIPGRLRTYETEASSNKLPFRCSKVDLLLMMLSLKDLGFIDVQSDHQLATFMERNFLYERKSPLKSLTVAISQYRTGEKSSATSLESIREILKPLFDQKFSIRN